MSIRSVFIGTLCAVALVSHAPQIRAASSTNLDAARELMTAGQNAFDRGAFSDAAAHWRQAAEQFAEKSDVAAQADALRRLGGAFVAMGLPKNAVSVLESALALTERGADPRRRALIQAGLGDALRRAGRTDEAAVHISAALKAAPDPATRATVCNDLGNLRLAEGDSEAALAAYGESRALAESVGDRLSAVRAAVNAARLHVDNGDTAAALPLLKTALTQAAKLPETHEHAFFLIAAGRICMDARSALPPDHPDAKNMPMQAHDSLRQAHAMAERLDDPLAASYALGYLGILYNDQNRRDEALQLTRQAVFKAQQVQAIRSLYRWQWQTGRLLKADGNLDGAIAAYRSAVFSLQQVRQDLAMGCKQGTCVSFKESVGPVFYELADLLLQRSAAKTDPEKKRRDLTEARDTVEILKAAELQDYFQDECITALKTKAMTLDQMPPRTAAIYPILLPDRTELLVTLPDGRLMQYTAAVSNADLAQWTDALRVKIQQPFSRYKRYAAQLYDWLMAPMMPELAAQNVDTLVFIPDGILRTIPLSVLYDGEKHIVEKFSVVTTPGLTLTDPRPLDRKRLQLLLNGLTEGVQGFSPLPSVSQELTEVQDMYSASVLKDEDFTVNSVETKLRETPYSIVHIASHGQFESDVRNSFLLAYDDKLTMDRLESIMGMSQYREEPVELLTLSACQTALGDDRAALGLAGVALKAGARSAIATLWFIDDRTTSELISDFYRQLKNPALDKAQALRNAQLYLLRQEDSAHPAYWAPFLLIGNWM